LDATIELGRLVTEALAQRKAVDVRVLDVRTLTDTTDYMIISGGTSNRHVGSIVEYLLETARQSGCVPIGIEGLPECSWVLVDFADVVVHVMLPETRKYYDLEGLWTDFAQPDPESRIAGTPFSTHPGNDEGNEHVYTREL